MVHHPDSGDITACTPRNALTIGSVIVVKDDFAMSWAREMMSLINKRAVWPPNYYKRARMFPKKMTGATSNQ